MGLGFKNIIALVAIAAFAAAAATKFGETEPALKQSPELGVRVVMICHGVLIVAIVVAFLVVVVKGGRSRRTASSSRSNNIFTITIRMWSATCLAEMKKSEHPETRNPDEHRHFGKEAPEASNTARQDHERLGLLSSRVGFLIFGIRQGIDPTATLQ